MDVAAANGDDGGGRGGGVGSGGTAVRSAPINSVSMQRVAWRT